MAKLNIVEVDKLSQSQVGLVAAYRLGFSLQEVGWLRYPPASWDKPAILAFDDDKCVAGINYTEDKDDLILSVNFAFCEPTTPAALVAVLSRFRRKFRDSAFTEIKFTCHVGNEQMAKAADVLNLVPASYSYRVPLERLRTMATGSAA